MGRKTTPSSPWASEARWLVALLVLLAVQAGLSALRHRDNETLRHEVEVGGVDGAWSLHILANRGEPGGIDGSLVGRLLASGDPLLVEMAMTHDVWRHAGRALQRDHLKKTGDRPLAIRGNYYLKLYGRPVTRGQLDRYFATLGANGPSGSPGPASP